MWDLSLSETIPWRRAWQPTPVFLPRESLGQRTLVGYSHKELDMTGVTQHAHTILMPEPSCSVPYISMDRGNHSRAEGSEDISPYLLDPHFFHIHTT